MRMLNDVIEGAFIGYFTRPTCETVYDYMPVLEPVEIGKPWGMLHSQTRSRVASLYGQKQRIQERFVPVARTHTSNLYKHVELENCPVSQSPLIQKIRHNEQEFYLGFINDKFVVYQQEGQRIIPRIVKEDVMKEQQHRGFLMKEGQKILETMVQNDAKSHYAVYPSLVEEKIA
jgi:hypothetical protein